MFWMWDLTKPGYVIAGVLYASYFAVAAALCPPGRARWIALPGAVLLAEVARWSFPFGGVPLGNLGLSQAAAPLGATVEGAALTEHVPVAHLEAGGSPLELQVLRLMPDGGERKDARAGPDLRAPGNDGVADELRALADRDLEVVECYLALRGGDHGPELGGLLERRADVTRVAIRLGTGRRHQIRRHLKHIAHPILGDATHGKGPLNRAVAEHRLAQAVGEA